MVEVRNSRDIPTFILASLAVIISAATLFVIGVYTYYAGGQWKQMIRAADAAHDSAEAAQSAATTADNTLGNQKTTFEIEQRPYIIAAVPEFLSVPVTNVPIREPLNKRWF